MTITITITEVIGGWRVNGSFRDAAELTELEEAYAARSAQIPTRIRDMIAPMIEKIS